VLQTKSDTTIAAPALIASCVEQAFTDFLNVCLTTFTPMCTSQITCNQPDWSLISPQCFAYRTENDQCKPFVTIQAASFDSDCLSTWFL